MNEPLADRFPAGFLWGAATSAYQVEGAVAEGGRTPSIWDTFAHTPGKTIHGDTGDIACDHYHRWPEDLALVRDLGLNAYRFSVSWPRLQPHGRGPLNPAGVAFYRTLLEQLRSDGVRPFVTLYHWELPQALEDAGGWPIRETAARFAEFAGLVVAALGDLAADWITINEPWCQAFLGYESGIHAPGRRHLPDAVAAAHHLNLAHGLAVPAIRAALPGANVGIANILTDVLPASDAPQDIAAAARYDANSNRMFLDPLLGGGYPDAVRELYRPHGLDAHVRAGDEAVISAPIDFLAVNHYHRVIVRDDPSDRHLGARGTFAEPATTSLGWSVTPEALRDLLLRVHRDYPPIPLYVTENGASFDDYVDPTGQVRDVERVAYLRGYLGAAAEAIDAGVDLRGYFAWSLLDNFEWGEGYRSRFGLVFVEYGTQRRIPKASAGWYRDLIAHHRRTTGAGRTADRDGPAATGA
jgi:beta-glucosidase